MEEERISYHKSVQKVYKRIKNDGMTNIWDRFEAQGFAGVPDKRCPFCLKALGVIYVLMVLVVLMLLLIRGEYVELLQTGWLCE